jgi:hypothetical protein
MFQHHCLPAPSTTAQTHWQGNARQMTQPFRIDFGHVSGRGPYGTAVDAIEAWLADLARLGEIAGSRVVGRDPRGWFAHVVVLGFAAPSLPAVDLRPWFAASPRWRAVGARSGKRPIRLGACRRLLLFASFVNADEPLQDFATGRPVPLAELGDDHGLRRSLTDWAHTFRNCDALWFGSGALERAAHTQLVSPRSDLLRLGGRVAQLVQRRTGLPTHRFVMGPNGRDARCPGCGGAWIRRAHGAYGWTRRCERCRLVSHAVARP